MMMDLWDGRTDSLDRPVRAEAHEVLDSSEILDAYVSGTMHWSWAVATGVMRLLRRMAPLSPG